MEMVENSDWRGGTPGCTYVLEHAEFQIPCFEHPEILAIFGADLQLVLRATRFAIPLEWQILSCTKAQFCSQALQAGTTAST
jgi:hypothetical protein